MEEVITPKNELWKLVLSATTWAATQSGELDSGVRSTDYVVEKPDGFALRSEWDDGEEGCVHESPILYKTRQEADIQLVFLILSKWGEGLRRGPPTLCHNLCNLGPLRAPSPGHDNDHVRWFVRALVGAACLVAEKDLSPEAKVEWKYVGAPEPKWASGT